MSVYVQYIVGNMVAIIGQREVTDRYRRGREPGAQGSMGRGPMGSVSAWRAGTKGSIPAAARAAVIGGQRVRWRDVLRALGCILSALHKLMQLDTQARRLWMRQ